MSDRRYVRAYLFDFNGDLLPPLMRNDKVSTALLPVMKLQGMKTYAGVLSGTDSEPRRKAVLDCLIAAQERATSASKPIYGVAIVACPDRRISAEQTRSALHPVTLTARNAYSASFAAVGAHNQMWAGDILRETLAQVETRIIDCVRHVRNKPTEALIDMFESVVS